MVSITKKISRSKIQSQNINEKQRKRMHSRKTRIEGKKLTVRDHNSRSISRKKKTKTAKMIVLRSSNGETFEVEDDLKAIDASSHEVHIHVIKRKFSAEKEMEAQHSEHGHVIEVCSDVPSTERGYGGSKACEGATCGFSDAKTSSKDAQERSASMKKLLIAVAFRMGSYPTPVLRVFRIEILGALVSIQLIWLLTGILVYEAIIRLHTDNGEVQGFLMFLVSSFGLLVNIIMALLLGHDHGHGHSHDHGHGHGHNHGHEDHEHGSEDDHTHSHGVIVTRHHHHHHPQQGHPKLDEHHHIHDGDPCEPLVDRSSEGENESKSGNKKKKPQNINVQGAYLHVLGDSIQSVGVMIGGAIIWYKPEWKIIDLICTLIFSAIVLGTTIKMLRNILEVLMESTPREIDATMLEKGLCEMEEVVAIHELHIWAITVGKVLLACHVKIKPEADADMVLDKVVDYIKREYNISHVTIQIERE
ncbi:hypothetical protein DH2020_020400 [Rehmannia glutinosa]|uniref:Metal tolerance protein n=1 Tax=Rehmannia glutinosa TaxID=99300 RepID=A0ABR0WI40_REHGL